MDDYRDLDEPDEYPGHYRHRVLRTRGAVLTASIISTITRQCPGAFRGLNGRQMDLLEREIASFLDMALQQQMQEFRGRMS